MMAVERLRVGFDLDRQWRLLRGQPDGSKRPALLALARVLAEAGTPYALIGGIALQVHRAEPRTTIDIIVAVSGFASIPADALQAAGFRLSGRHAHTENWVGPGGVPVEFTDDPALASALGRSLRIELDGVPIDVIGRADLLHAKLRAGVDPGRRRSKRLQDVADAQALLEETPELAAELSASERALLERLPP